MSPENPSLRDAVLPAFSQDGINIYCGDTIEVMRTLPAGIARTCVTSPPYWGLRDYGVEGQLGLEPTPDEYVANMVNVFREVRRVLADDATLWLNIGDSYNAYNGGAGPGSKLSKTQSEERPQLASGYGLKDKSLKPKDLVGIPWMLAFALRADGWYLRQDIIWAKPNPMPESVTDRCTKAHEYIFLMSKSERYYYDAEAIAEPVTESTIERMSQPTLDQQAGSDRVPGKTNGTMKAVMKGRGGATSFRGQGHFRDGSGPANRNDRDMRDVGAGGETRNKRSVWTVTTKPYKAAHFATFPPDLIEPCILAGSAPGDLVLDPFNGSGTTGHVCREHGRRYIGIELNPEYVELTKKRFAQPILFQPTGGAA